MESGTWAELKRVGAEGQFAPDGYYYIDYAEEWYAEGFDEYMLDPQQNAFMHHTYPVTWAWFHRTMGAPRFLVARAAAPRAAVRGHSVPIQWSARTGFVRAWRMGTGGRWTRVQGTAGTLSVRDAACGAHTLTLQFSDASEAHPSTVHLRVITRC